MDKSQLMPTHRYPNSKRLYAATRRTRRIALGVCVCVLFNTHTTGLDGATHVCIYIYTHSTRSFGPPFPTDNYQIPTTTTTTTTKRKTLLALHKPWKGSSLRRDDVHKRSRERDTISVFRPSRRDLMDRHKNQLTGEPSHTLRPFLLLLWWWLLWVGKEKKICL